MSLTRITRAAVKRISCRLFTRIPCPALFAVIVDHEPLTCTPNNPWTEQSSKGLIGTLIYRRARVALPPRTTRISLVALPSDVPLGAAASQTSLHLGRLRFPNPLHLDGLRHSNLLHLGGCALTPLHLGLRPQSLAIASPPVYNVSSFDIHL